MRIADDTEAIGRRYRELFRPSSEQKSRATATFSSLSRRATDFCSPEPELWRFVPDIRLLSGAHIGGAHACMGSFSHSGG